jgi:hypothetical protein
MILQTHPARQRKAGILGIILALAAMSILFAGPAQAAETTHGYYNAYIGNTRWLVAYEDSGDTQAFMSNFVGQTWHIQQISDSPSGHDRVFLKTESSGGRCLDSHAAKNGGGAWVISCNGGDYQIWEVFYESNNARVFKSWGAWTKQGLHLCLATTSANHYVIMSTCNESSARQQWYISS